LSCMHLFVALVAAVVTSLCPPLLTIKHVL
jgi:hypothetical protein